jgi:hypothetical protein
MTSFVPASPRVFSDRRNAVQKRPVLRVADGEPEDLTAPVGGDTGGDHDRLGHHPRSLAVAGATDPGLAAGRVEEHIGERGLREAAVGEVGDLLIEIGADPGDLGLGDPGVGAQGADEVVDLAH